MEVVLDTNVIVSALISPRGAPAEIFSAWQRGRFTYVTSPPLLDELARALSYPRVRKFLTWTDEERGEFLEALAYAARLVIPTIELNEPKAMPLLHQPVQLIRPDERNTGPALSNREFGRSQHQRLECARRVLQCPKRGRLPGEIWHPIEEDRDRESDDRRQ